ncbi:MAG: alpha/beta hydrolase-fold protein [Alphaproteobacteria bacterium]
MALKESRPKEIGNTVFATEIRHVRSECVDQEFRLIVGLPPPSPPGTKVPVVYALDGGAFAGLLIGFVRSLPSLYLPPVVVVAIGYPIESNRPFRNRDYTPTHRASSDELIAKLGPILGGGQVEPVASGGAPAFLRFIEDELKPFIEAEYSGDPADATITGLSLGGLFGAYALFNKTSAFRRYHIVSPSLWWDDQLILKQEMAHAASSKELNAKVFLSVGGLETNATMAKERAKVAETTSPQVMAALDRLTAAQNFSAARDVIEQFGQQLAARNYKGLELTTHVFEGETHTSVYAPALSRGLRTLFGTYET